MIAPLALAVCWQHHEVAAQRHPEERAADTVSVAEPGVRLP